MPVQISFLLGPAGSGKTFRCLEEIRRELAHRSEEAPLIFLAPKQATYQLERQLLENGDVQGYCRLNILSFERLAHFVFDAFKIPAPSLLSEQGRVMVLRALMEFCRDQLSIFGRSVRRLGFARELSDQIREFQQMGLTPERIKKMAGQLSGRTADKLRDLALLFERYRAWLRENELEDGDALLSLAAEKLEAEPDRLKLGGIWFDGFAQLTPQERRLLMALLACSTRATLAFCLESETRARSYLSPWFLVSESCARCKTEAEKRFGKKQIKVVRLERNVLASRFSASPALARLERFWAGAPEENETAQMGFDFESARGSPEHTLAARETVQIRICSDPEAEAAFCAREILKFARAGGRFREAAVLLRSFENDYAEAVPRVFRRYDIPFFLDRRQNVSHHPLAELTRGALRTLAYGWKHTDLFTAFKSGLMQIRFEALDELENAALENGWDEAAWKDGFSFRKQDARREWLLDSLNELRTRLIEPFVRLQQALTARPDGSQLAGALRDLWKTLKIEEQLEEWARQPAEAFHATVWEQMISWLNNIDLAFARHPLPLRDWLPILEAGLSGLSVGIIPPTLDQVLIGAVDRSRNPDLRLAFILGANETIFPSVPAHDRLLTQEDRLALLGLGCEPSGLPAVQIAQEQFYGYIACTRPRERLVVTCSSAALDGTLLNPSRFIAQIRTILPEVIEENWFPPESFEETEHPCELPSFLAKLAGETRLEGALAEWRDRMRALRAPETGESLAPEVAQQLYGPELKIAVSSTERFASCPYRFFVEQGLKAGERKEFRVDVREHGHFQHEVLLEFHRAVRARGKKWRDLSKEEALDLVADIAETQLEQFGGGLFRADEQSKFIARNYKAALQAFIGLVIDWLKDANQFDPEEVELPFGNLEAVLPAWRIPLEHGNALLLEGRIDRVDLWRDAENRRALCVVIDYKSGMKRPDPALIERGIEQQLPGYLLALTRVKEAKKFFQVDELIAAGSFLIPLRSSYETATNRTEALDGEKQRGAFKHYGFFDLQHLSRLDSKHDDGGSGQFHYSINGDGTPSKTGFHALETEKFQRILERSEALLRSFGKRIYAGDISIHPFKKGTKTACDQCHNQSICRFDPWVQKFNVIKNPRKSDR